MKYASSGNSCHEKVERHHTWTWISFLDAAALAQLVLFPKCKLGLMRSEGHEVGGHCLLQEIFPTQGSNPSLPYLWHCSGFLPTEPPTYEGPKLSISYLQGLETAL